VKVRYIKGLTSLGLLGGNVVVPRAGAEYDVPGNARAARWIRQGRLAPVPAPEAPPEEEIKPLAAEPASSGPATGVQEEAPEKPGEPADQEQDEAPPKKPAPRRRKARVKTAPANEAGPDSEEQE